MNHLSIGVGIEGGLRVIFDAGRFLGRDDDDEDIQEPEDDVDLTSFAVSCLSSYVFMTTA